jgi:hypothetical protein
MPLDSKSVVEAFNVIEQDGQNVNFAFDHFKMEVTL